MITLIIPKKSIIFLLMLFIFVIASLFSSCRAKEPEYDYLVEFKDPAFEYAVRAHLAIPEDDIYYKTLKGLKIVYVWPNMVQFNNDKVIMLPDGMKVASAEDLVHFENLSGLLFANMDYENIDLIADFKKLQRVILYENKKLTDINALKELPRLADLSVHDNAALRDFSVISELSPTVAELNLSYSGLTDISFLSGVTSLKVVYLNNNEITDLSPLSKCVNILELSLGSNKLTDISVLAGFTKMYKLRLENNQITDLSPLKELAKLSTLSIENNNVTDLSPLAGKPAMRRLWLSGNPSLADKEVSAIRQDLPEKCEIDWAG